MFVRSQAPLCATPEWLPRAGDNDNFREGVVRCWTGTASR